MPIKDTILSEIRAALEHEPRLNVHRDAIHLAFCNGNVTLDGEVGSIVAKRIALEHARTLNGISSTIDRLRVIPGERRGDGAVRDALAAFLLGDTTFQDYFINARSNNGALPLHDPGKQAQGSIEIDTQDGIVTLRGVVGSLSHKRLAGVLAWWTPGCCDVTNELEVKPLEYDNDDEILDALRLVLEKDPLVHAHQIRAESHNAVITLHGLLATEEERKMAELNAWYLFGVRDVVNLISVQH